jgi:hypothetical protein
VGRSIAPSWVVDMSPADLTDEELCAHVLSAGFLPGTTSYEMARRLRAANERLDGYATCVGEYVGKLHALRDQLSAANERIAKLEGMVREAVGCIDTRTQDGVFWGARADLKARLLAQLDGGKTPRDADWHLEPDETKV